MKISRALSCALTLLGLVFVAGCGTAPSSMDAGVEGPQVEAGLADQGTPYDAEIPVPDAMWEDAAVGDASLPDAALPSMGLLMEGHQLFFVGNSYTGGLIGRYRSFAAADPVERIPFRVEGVSPGGQRFAGHLDSARNDGSALNIALVTGSAEERDWDVVVLQEQSQIPGFPPTHAEYRASLMAVVELAGMVEETGATTVLYMTWGRRDGDERNPGLYPDFLTMQERLEAGYRIYAARIAESGHRAVIAPVGPAFRLIYRDVEAEGMVPSDPGSAFHALYSGDGSHPSLEGTYLTAAVILGAVTGGEVVDVDWAPGGIPSDRARALRAVADRANALEWARGDS